MLFEAKKTTGKVIENAQGVADVIKYLKNNSDGYKNYLTQKGDL